MITTHGLSKDYGGGTRALDGVALNVRRGSIYGLVGPNGAGKTTLLGVLSGLRKATAGTMSIETRRIGVLPDTPLFDNWLTAREVVDLALNTSNGSNDPERVTTVLEQAGISDAADRAVGGFSRGMLQRLGVAATLVAEPELVLLDEPCSALDPLGRREVLDLVSRLRGDATVVFSSHILADVQEVCDTVGILRQGKLIFEGPLGQLLVGRAQPQYQIRLRPPVDRVVAGLADIPWINDVTQIDPEVIQVSGDSSEVMEGKLVHALAAVDAQVVSMVPEAPSLEDVFLELVK